MLLASVSSQVLRRRKKSASEEKASVTADSDFSIVDSFPLIFVLFFWESLEFDGACYLFD